MYDSKISALQKLIKRLDIEVLWFIYTPLALGDGWRPGAHDTPIASTNGPTGHEMGPWRGLHLLQPILKVASDHSRCTDAAFATPLERTTALRMERVGRSPCVATFIEEDPLPHLV